MEGSSATFLSVRRRRRVRWERGLPPGGDFLEALFAAAPPDAAEAVEAVAAAAAAAAEQEEARRSLSSAELTAGSASALLAPAPPHERTSSRLAARSTNAARARGPSGGRAEGEDAASSLAVVAATAAAAAATAAAAAVVLVLCRGKMESRTSPDEGGEGSPECSAATEEAMVDLRKSDSGEGIRSGGAVASPGSVCRRRRSRSLLAPAASATAAVASGATEGLLHRDLGDLLRRSSAGFSPAAGAGGGDGEGEARRRRLLVAISSPSS